MYKSQLLCVVLCVILSRGLADAAVIDCSAITVTESADNWGQLPGTNLVDGSGLDANGLCHINRNYGSWIGNDSGTDTSAAPGTTAGPAWVQFEFDQIYKLDEVWVWNANISYGRDYGMRNVIVEYSTDGNTWYTKSTYEFPKANGLTTYTGFSAFDFAGVSARYVVFTAASVNGNWGYPNIYALSEVRFNGTSDFAGQASPEDDELDVSINTDLSWVKGDSAADVNGQQIYFGTSYYGVSTATTTSDPCGVYKGTQSNCSYVPGTLAKNVTYYWRVDEVNGVNSWKGCVRQFTTSLNDSIASSKITATASNDCNGFYPAKLAKNKSGLDSSLLLHSTSTTTMWFASSSGNSSANPDITSGPAWIMFVFDNVCDLQEMWVWNCNDGITNRNCGLRDVAVEYSSDGDTWYKLGDYTFTQASGLANDPGVSACDFNGAKARYVVITAKTSNGNWGGNYYSLSEVRFYGSESTVVREVQSGVPWTMQYDATNINPKTAGSVTYSDGTTGCMFGSQSLATAESSVLDINTMASSSYYCYFYPDSNYVDTNSTTGYTVEWRAKLISANTTTANSACSISGNPAANKCWVVGLVKHNGKIWAHQFYTAAGDPCEVEVDSDADNPAYHTMRVVVENGNATLYVDGVYASQASLYSQPIIYKVRFGDVTDAAGANFKTDYFYVYDGGGITPKEFREPAKNRKRRVIFDNDGGDITMDLQGTTVQEFWDDRMTGLIGTQTDTIVYCPVSSGFGQFTYDTTIGDILTSKAGILSNNKTADYIAQGTDALKMTVDFCRQNGFEVFFSMRMNDIHDGQGWMAEFFNQFKKDHYSWLFGYDDANNPVNGYWTGVDYSEPNIRNHALALFEEVCQNYDVDGIVLDFFRHPVFFQSQADGGVASIAEKQEMTDLITDIREMTDREGLKRGKPILIAVVTPDDVNYAGNIGLDITTWMANDLIDLWVPTGYYRIDTMEDGVALGHQYGVKVYPCMSECRMSDALAKASRSSDRAYYAEAQNWFYSGADGVYSFNYFINHASPLFLNTYPRLRYMGDPNTLAGRDKTYSTSMLGYSEVEVYYAGGKGFWDYNFVAPEKVISLPASTNETMDILIGEDVANADPSPNVLLRLRFDTAPAAIDDLAVTLNDTYSLSGYRRLDFNSATGYTVEWRIKLTEADASSGGYAFMKCSPESDKYWYVSVLQHDDKNWVQLSDGSEIELDSDKDNPAYHTLGVTAYNGYAKLYIDGDSSPADTHALHSGGPYALCWGDVSGSADANSYYDYVYASDDGAHAPGEPNWTMQYDVDGKRPIETGSVTYSDGTTGRMYGGTIGFASVYSDANYLDINTLNSNNSCIFYADSNYVDTNSTTGYTVEWRAKLLSVDTTGVNWACSFSGSPMLNKAWIVALIEKDGKILAHQYYTAAGDPCEAILDNDANDPAFHTLRVTVENDRATLYVDGVYASSASLYSYGTIWQVRFGDPTGSADVEFLTDYFYVYDGGAVPPMVQTWTVRYEGSALPSSSSACSYSDGTTGPLVAHAESPYSSVFTSYTSASVEKSLRINTIGSNQDCFFTFDDQWFHYRVNPTDVENGWNEIGMTLGAGKNTVTLKDLLVEVDY
ncbi:MAG: hypothetical protein A2Y12_09785 [Planctomycetes bacterium GWF2_42_9]|nr:MAG: hypothetical protein A2Y12_09785 [Planctomycetes bacterium GWF2_42_9]